MSRDLRDIRRALARSESQNFVGLRRPGSAGNLSLGSGGLSAASGLSQATHKVAPADYSKDIGLWVARRLTDLDASEHGAFKRFSEGRGGKQEDPQLWGADRVSKWLRESVGLSESTISDLFEQDMHGMELFTLDDADLSALGCPLAERKRLLQMVTDLRRAAPAARAAAASEASEHHGRGAMRLHLDSRRERLTVLGQCLGRVLSFCPSVPLRTRRLLTVLWQQTEAVAVEALVQIERDQITHERRALAAAERNRRTVRNAIEPHMALCAKLEDMVIELENCLSLERAQLQILRDSVQAPEASRRRLKGEGEAHRSLHPADYPIGSWDLGDKLERVGESLDTFLEEHEREGWQGDRVLAAADKMQQTLTRGIYEQEKRARQAAAKAKAAEEARKAAALAAAAAPEPAPASRPRSGSRSPSRSGSRPSSRPSSGARGKPRK
jgi:hypothetical protein